MTRAGAPVRDGHGRVMVHLAGGQDSHVISALAAADALAVVPEADDALPAGAPWTCGGSTAPSGRGAARRRTLVLHPA